MSITHKPFSLRTYLLIVVAVSWPFQIAYLLWAETPFMRYALSSLPMIMVTVATYIAGRYVFRDGFSKAGWSWGKSKQYLAVFSIAIFVWVVPTILELVLGMRSIPRGIVFSDILGNFLLRFLATLIPAFGEEFGWRGYMLPHLAKRYSLRTALLLHSLIWWAWHLPVLMGMGITEKLTNNVVTSIATILAVSLIPAMMHAIVFAYIWTVTQSLAVVTVYHAAFDEIRDAIASSIGYGSLVEIWQMLTLTILGGLLLWKGNWQQLTARKT
ncbi:type II CAAX endopeptidase family protein [Nodularia harveyana UHCC-0300]|uniref:Type II CAAX endopeptidase family protein n=1 Tax=Nodularia harveyana UHCC-0300 TaxID=2974287 RepID=A0ABU5U9K5_9CYAN|nr:type II CAAX endopeptidase family protein [Nodularia harveyana]MEA5580192.1 type II CAAX endopeptidase family protein [Nodularia harveyana UHCC-0300]